MIGGDLSRSDDRSLRRPSEGRAARENFTAHLALNSGKQAHFMCSKGSKIQSTPERCSPFGIASKSQEPARSLGLVSAREPTGLAGTPARIEPGSHERVTTAPAATIEPAPIRTPGNTVTWA